MAKGPRSISSRRSSGPSARRWPSIPSGSWSISASARTTKWRPRAFGPSWPREINRPENRGYADNGIAAYKEAAARFMQRELRRRARSGHGSQPLHRLEAGAGDAAGGVHQSGRRHADDRARLSGGRHAHALLRRRGASRCRCWPRTISFPISDRFRPTCCGGRSCWCSIIPTARPASVATREFYQRVVEFALRHQIVVVQDAAHVMLTLRGHAAEFSVGARARRKWASKSIRCRRDFT